MRWLAEVRVFLKPSVNDPEGQSIRGGLRSLGFTQVDQVRAGKLIQVWLEAPDQASAEGAIDLMCTRLLANPVIERYEYRVSEAAEQTAAAG